MKHAFVQQTDKPDALGLARFRIVCHTPGRAHSVIYWTGAEERIVRELLGAGYVIQVGGVGLQPAEMEKAP